MRRSSLNFLVDMLGFLVLLGLVGTGVILKYVLPPGSGGRGHDLHGGEGGEHIKQLLSMGRHDWGDIHFYLSIAFVLLMVIHIVLHFKWIKAYIQSLSCSADTDNLTDE